jgi:hypothetical protein
MNDPAISTCTVGAGTNGSTVIDLLAVIVKDDVVRAGRKVRQIDLRRFRGRDQKRPALDVVERHAQERPQIAALHLDARLIALVDPRRRDAEQLRRRRAEQQVRAVGRRDQHEDDHDDREVDEIDPPADAPAIVDYGHVE